MDNILSRNGAGKRGRGPWAPIAALLYGAATVGLLTSLAAILGLEASDKGGLYTGAAVVFLFCLWAAAYLQRSSARVAVKRPADS